MAAQCLAPPRKEGLRGEDTSGYALPEDVQRSHQAGFDFHLPKPPDIAKIEELLAELPSVDIR